MSNAHEVDGRVGAHHDAAPERERATTADRPHLPEPALPGPLRLAAGALSNASMARLLQPKLAVGPPGDEYEREADRMADRVAGPVEPARSPAATSPSGSGGRPLDPATRGHMEDHLGGDLSAVRVHTESPAPARLGAVAFTVGTDVVFAPGRYQPATAPGVRLLAHELAHVVQQAGAGPRVQRQPAGGTVTSTEDAGVPAAAAPIEVAGVVVPPDEAGRRALLLQLVTQGGLHGAQFLSAALAQEADRIDGEIARERAIERQVAEQGPLPGGVPWNEDMFAERAAAATQAREARSSLEGMVQRLHADFEAFRRLVLAATAVRLEGNRAALVEWSTYLHQQLSPEELRRQVLAEQERALIRRAATGPRPSIQLDAAERRSRSHSAAIRRVEGRVARNEIGGGCQYCHEIQGAINFEYSHPDLSGATPSPLETLQEAAEAESGAPTPPPGFQPDTPAPDVGGQPLGAYPGVSAEAAALEQIRPVLRQLGEEGFKVLPADLINSRVSDAELLARIDTAIETRRANFAELAARTREPGFDYTIPRPVLRELLPLAPPDVQAVVRHDLERAASDAEAEAVLIGLATIAALLLTIFPPTAPIGIALDIGLAGYGIVTGLEQYEQGQVLSLGIGSTVLDAQQQEAAHGLIAMGALNIVLSVVGITAAGLGTVRLIRSGTGANAVLEAVEAEAGATRITVTELNTSTPRVSVAHAEGVTEGTLAEFGRTANARLSPSRELADDFLRRVESHGLSREDALYMLGLRNEDELYALAAGARTDTELQALLSRRADATGVSSRADLSEQGRASSSAVDEAPASGPEEPGRMPELESREPVESWAERVMRGNDFNAAQRGVYAAEELRLANGMIVDGYTPGQAIVSRKETQLASIRPERVEEYVNEFLDKYGPGNLIADTPRNRQLYGNLVGQRLQGPMVLEVPIQSAPIPQELGTWARRLGITIRDQAGTVYN
ncbi:DUF4157 domain-containing protein [Phytohabitans aurantiacus]|uniref:DUF4157 domain-containing protein n=1 Tax=Phytohabitans aurantiacus TaxID=3016789 RepID=UPI002493512C|nr:DUF4157 domain-containing protein [Phytohabitans aurantiacus]